MIRVTADWLRSGERGGEGGRERGDGKIEEEERVKREGKKRERKRNNEERSVAERDNVIAHIKHGKNGLRSFTRKH